MKKYFSLFFILLMTAAAHAQTVGTTARELSQLSRHVARAAGESSFQMQMLHMAGLTGGKAFQFTKQLERQAQAALEQAYAASSNMHYPLKFPFGVVPVVDMKIGDKWQLVPYTIWGPNLEKNRDIALYMISEENLLFVRETKRLKEHVWPQLNSKIEQLEQAAANTPQVADPLHTVIENLPSAVNTLFVGELHGYPEIKQAVYRILKQLREQQPNRKIILFTEFLPKDFAWKGKIPSSFNEWHGDHSIVGFWNKNLRKLWDRASELGIPSIGLEPMRSCLNSSASFFQRDRKNVEKKKIDFDTSLTGMQYRNDNFVDLLQRYRKKYPDALFVVYTGAAHVEYHYFSSVSAQFELEKSFVLALLPSVERIAKKFHTREIFTIHTGHPIRDFTWAGNFPQKFQLFNKELAPIAGVDALIRLETPRE